MLLKSLVVCKKGNDLKDNWIGLIGEQGCSKSLLQKKKTKLVKNIKINF